MVKNHFADFSARDNGMKITTIIGVNANSIPHKHRDNPRSFYYVNSFARCINIDTERTTTGFYTKTSDIVLTANRYGAIRIKPHI